MIQTGVSAADRTMKAQLVGELRTMLTHKVGAGPGAWVCGCLVVGAGLGGNAVGMLWTHAYCLQPAQPG